MTDGLPRLDVGWRRPHLAALLVLLAAWAMVLLVQVKGDWMAIGQEIPVMEDRVEAARERIDLNNASVASLCRLPGIGPARAGAIVAARDSLGLNPFGRLEDLYQVKGIKAKTAARLAPYLKFPPSPATSSPTTRP